MPYIIPKHEPTTPKSREALEQFGRELRKLDLGKLTNLTKDKFITFVKDVHYDWFAQTSDVLRMRLVNYAKQNVDEVKPWFLAAEEIRPGFFRHPVEFWDIGARSFPQTHHLCAEFDALVELGLIPPPNSVGTIQVAATGEATAPALPNTHFPNPYNCIPENVVAKRPDLAGKTREEAWLSDLDQRDKEYGRFMGSVRQHLTQGVEALEVDNNPLTATFCEWLRDFLVQLEASNPEKTFASVYNAAHGCIAADANKLQAEALAKRLPVFRPVGPITDAAGGAIDKLNRSETPAFEVPRFSTCSTVVETPNLEAQKENIPPKSLSSFPLPSFSHSTSSFEPVLTERERSQQPETTANQCSEASSLPKPTPSGLGSRPIILPIIRSVSTRASSSGPPHKPEESDHDHQRPEKRQRQD